MKLTKNLLQVTNKLRDLNKQATKQVNELNISIKLDYNNNVNIHLFTHSPSFHSIDIALKEWEKVKNSIDELLTLEVKE